MKIHIIVDCSTNTPITDTYGDPIMVADRDIDVLDLEPDQQVVEATVTW